MTFWTLRWRMGSSPEASEAFVTFVTFGSSSDEAAPGVKVLASTATKGASAVEGAAPPAKIALTNAWDGAADLVPPSVTEETADLAAGSGWEITVGFASCVGGWPIEAATNKTVNLDGETATSHQETNRKALGGASPGSEAVEGELVRAAKFLQGRARSYATTLTTSLQEYYA